MKTPRPTLIAAALFIAGLVAGRHTAPRTIGDCNAELEARYWRAKCYFASQVAMDFVFPAVRADLGLEPYTVRDFLEVERKNAGLCLPQSPQKGLK